MKRYTFLQIGIIVFFSSCVAGKHNTQNNSTADHSPSFLFMSDIHLSSFSEGTQEGHDTGLGLWKNFLNKVDTLLSGSNAPRFIVCTGDLPAHYHCGESCYLDDSARQTHNADIATALLQLSDLVAKRHTPFFYLPGNNDAIAGDYYSFADKKNNTALSLLPKADNTFPALNCNADGHTPPCILPNAHLSMGYYAALVAKGIKLIAMNTVIFDRKFTTVDGTDPQADGEEELQWLLTELQAAAAAKEKVFIAMHIPPGVDAYQYMNAPASAGMWARSDNSSNSWLNRFLTIIAQNKNCISGILYGHTHMDELRRLYDSTGKTMTALAIGCPGITPLHHNNPGFKIVTYGATSRAILDCTTYYTYPTAVRWGNASYSFNTVFGFVRGNTMFKNVSASPLANLAANMSKIFTVMNGPANYDVQPGIDVQFGQ